MGTAAVSDDSFQTDVIEGSNDLPVLVDFWAEWCGPCKMIAPSLDRIAESMEGQVKVVKINIDDNPMTPSKYGVRGIPTLILFKDGLAVSQKVGAAPHAALANWVAGYI
jgi:thioredoxin 1